MIPKVQLVLFFQMVYGNILSVAVLVNSESVSGTKHFNLCTTRMVACIGKKKKTNDLKTRTSNSSKKHKPVILEDIVYHDFIEGFVIVHETDYAYTQPCLDSHTKGVFQRAGLVTY